MYMSISLLLIQTLFELSDIGAVAILCNECMKSSSPPQKKINKYIYIFLMKSTPGGRGDSIANEETTGITV